MPGHLWEFLLCRLVFSPSSLEGIPAALACLLQGPPSLIVLASLETPSENTCSGFTSVSLALKMAQKRLCPDRDNGTPAKGKNNPPAASAKKTQPTMPKSSETAHHRDSAQKKLTDWSLYSRSNEPSDTVPLVEMQFF